MFFGPVSCTNKTDRHDITEILLKVALNIINHKLNLMSFGLKSNFIFTFNHKVSIFLCLETQTKIINA